MRDDMRTDLRLKRLTEFVSVAVSPLGPTELDALKQEGFRSVLDVRQDGDPPGPLSPPLLSAALTDRAMAYARLSLPMTRVDDDLLDRFGQVIRNLPKPVAVQCVRGKRAGMFALTHVAIEQGMPGEAMLETARELDLIYGPRELQRAFKQYVDRGEREPDPLFRRAEVASWGGSPGTSDHRQLTIPIASATQHFAKRVVPRPLVLGSAAGAATAALLLIAVNRRILVPLAVVAVAAFIAQRALRSWQVVEVHEPSGRNENRLVEELRGRLRALAN